MDTILRGSIAGFLSTLVYVAIDWFFYLIGVTPSTVVHYGAVLITPPETEITAVTLILGFLAVSIAGSFVGVSISIMLRLTGIDYIYIKTLCFPLVLWIVHVSILPRLVVPELFRIITIEVIIANLVIKVTWAISYAFIYTKLNKYGGNRIKEKSSEPIPKIARRYYKEEQHLKRHIKKPKKLE